MSTTTAPQTVMAASSIALMTLFPAKVHKYSLVNYTFNYIKIGLKFHSISKACNRWVWWTFAGFVDKRKICEVLFWVDVQRNCSTITDYNSDLVVLKLASLLYTIFKLWRNYAWNEDIRYTGFIQYTSPHCKLMRINSTFLLLNYHSYITRQLRGIKTKILIREQEFVIHFRPPLHPQSGGSGIGYGCWVGGEGGGRKSCRVSFRVLHRGSKHPQFDRNNLYKFLKIDCFLLSYSKIVI